MKDDRINLIGKNRKEIAGLCGDLFIEEYRADQLYGWIYSRNVDSFDSMTNLSLDLRLELKRRFILSKPGIVDIRSVEETSKYLLRFDDDSIIETVSMKEKGHNTLCLSVQVGCPCGCRYCATGMAGYVRDITVAEIIGSALIMIDDIDDSRPVNVVFMGMGEPLLNFDALVDSISILIDQDGIGIPERRITVSTAGIVGKIKELKRRFPRIGISLSLNAIDDELRSELMPVNKTNNLDEIIEEIKGVEWSRRNPLTLEYVLIEDINDSPGDAMKLAKTAGSLKACINLIPLNPVEGFDGEAPDEQNLNSFIKIIADAGIAVTVRRSRGQDLKAACGQLRGKLSREEDVKERGTA